MSKNRFHSKETLLALIFAVTFPANVDALVSSSKTVSIDEVPWIEDVPLELGATWDTTVLPGQQQCVEFQVPAAGILTVEARVPATAESEPHLIAAEDSQTTLIVQRASHLTLKTPAGHQRFCIGAQDSRLGLADVKIVSAFVAHLPFKDEPQEDPREMEDEPGRPDPPPSNFNFGKALERTRDGEQEVAGGSARLWLDPALDPIRSELCRRLQRLGEGNDHSDSFLCASPTRAAQTITGELQSFTGDDRDVFEFAVPDLRTLEIRTSGSTDTYGSLYNSQGDRLVASEDGGEGENFRLIKTLLPGRYFVVVESDRRDEGTYQLHIG